MEPPRFCPWCGSPIGFEPHEHEPRFALEASLARARGTPPPPLPDRVREVLTGEAFVGVCQRCRTLSHVVGHRPPG